MAKKFLLKIFAVWLFFVLLLAPGIYCAAMTSYLNKGAIRNVFNFRFFIIRSRDRVDSIFCNNVCSKRKFIKELNHGEELAITKRNFRKH